MLLIFGSNAISFINTIASQVSYWYQILYFVMVSLSYRKIASFSFSYNKKTKNAKTFAKIKPIDIVDTQYMLCNVL